MQKVYEVPRITDDQDENYVSPPPSPREKTPPRAESPIYISSDEELLVISINTFRYIFS